jgi:GR25 family glycosyltransferase involved in LPS biosynthesis
MTFVLFSRLLMFFLTLESILTAAEAFQQKASFGSRSKVISPIKKPAYRPSPASISIGSTVREAERSAVLDWSFLDGVYIITCPNADPNGERLEKAKMFLDSVGLLDKVEVKAFDTDDEDRIRGCYTSHISVIKDAVRQNSAKSKSKSPFDDFFEAFAPKDGSASGVSGEKNVNVLVLEDNLALSGAKVRQATIDAVAKYCRSDADWDMIHLSYIPYVPNLKVSRTDDEQLVKLSCGVGSALGTTAYIINTKAMKRVLQDDEEKGGFYAPIPDVMAEIFPETRYAVDPTIFVRAPNTASLVNPQLDDLRTLLFQPAVAAFAQRLLLTTGLTTNALLPIVIVLLMIASAASAVATFESAWTFFTTGSLDGPIILPLLSASFALFSLAVLAKGVMLAPKQESS